MHTRAFSRTCYYQNCNVLAFGKKWPQYHYPADQHWEPLANLTMIGDAAHRMPPYAGEGVNMAMQDAMELAAQLLSDEHTTVMEAIATFEKQMYEREV